MTLDASIRTIDVWHLSVDPSDIAGYSRFTTEEEQARSPRFRRVEDAAAHLASRALLRSVLASHLGTAPAGIVLDTRCAHCGDPTHGRPRLDVVDAGVEFSLTRAGGVVAVALANVIVGLDAEPAREDLGDLARTQVFSVTDRDVLRAHPETLLDLWVAKEAVGKASGLGLVDARGVRSAPAGAGWQPAIDAREGRWWVRRVDIPGVAAAAVAASEPADVRIREGSALLRR